MIEEILLFDKQLNPDTTLQFLKVITNPLNLNISTELKGSKKTLSFTIERDSDIYEEQYLRCFGEEWVIKEIEEDSQWMTITALQNLEYLSRTPIARFLIQRKPLIGTDGPVHQLFLYIPFWNYVFAPDVLADTDLINRQRTISSERSNPLAIIEQIASTYFLEYAINTQDKTVTFFKKRGANKGAYISDELNLRTISVNKNSYDYVTRLIPIGKDGINISTVNGGSVVLENYQYTNKILTAYWVDNRYTIPAHLKEDGVRKLEEMSKPVRAYSCDIVDLANISPEYGVLDFEVGDEIVLLSKNMEIRDNQRIVKLVEYPYAPERNNAELANRQPSFEDVQNILIDTRNAVQAITDTSGNVIGSNVIVNSDPEDPEVVSSLSDAFLQVVQDTQSLSIAISSIEGDLQNYRIVVGEDAPIDPAVGDLWLYTVEGSSESTLYRFSGTDWLEVSYDSSNFIWAIDRISTQVSEQSVYEYDLSTVAPISSRLNSVEQITTAESIYARLTELDRFEQAAHVGGSPPFNTILINGGIEDSIVKSNEQLSVSARTETGVTRFLTLNADKIPVGSVVNLYTYDINGVESLVFSNRTVLSIDDVTIDDVNYKSIVFDGTNVTVNEGDTLHRVVWYGVNATLSQPNGSVQTTGQNTSDTVRLRQDTNHSLDGGNKMYIRAEIRVDNTSCTHVGMSIIGNTSVTHQVAMTPDLVGRVIEIEAIADVSGAMTGNAQIDVWHKYSSSSVANGKTAIIYDVIAIPFSTSNIMNSISVGSMKNYLKRMWLSTTGSFQSLNFFTSMGWGKLNPESIEQLGGLSASETYAEIEQTASSLRQEYTQTVTTVASWQEQEETINGTVYTGFINIVNKKTADLQSGLNGISNQYTDLVARVDGTEQTVSQVNSFFQFNPAKAFTPWTASTLYIVGAVVSHNGSYYQCTTQHTSGTTFSTTNWIEVDVNAHMFMGQTTTGGDSLRVKLSTQRMSFFKGNSELAWFASDGMYITKAEIVNELILGPIKIAPRSLDILDFEWIGN